MQKTVLRFTNYVLRTSLCVLLLLAASCSSATPTAQAEALHIQYTFAAQPWLANLYNCAGNNVVETELRAADFLDPQSVNLAIRIGQPTDLTGSAYQIGTEEILVVANRQNPVTQLTAEQVRGLFTGQVQTWKDISGTDAPVQVWVFPAGEDIQQIFEQTALGGSPVTSAARLANTSDEMSQAIANDVNAVGILTRHGKTGNISDVFTAATAPVLAIAPSEPDNTMAGILACLQK